MGEYMTQDEGERLLWQARFGVDAAREELRRVEARYAILMAGVRRKVAAGNAALRGANDGSEG